ncbi:MAG: hypothetical protein LBG92_09585 [Prevotellaceae bacterium]|jgi:hypothetical protein|nr:hypothetical protein [Prevotellaceae bacterium]
MKKYLLLCTLSFSLYTTVNAQEFDEAIDKLSTMMISASKEQDYKTKQSYIKTFAELLEKTLKKPNSIYQNFDSIPYMKVISSKDGIVRIYNWGIPCENGEYQYSAILQRRIGGSHNPLSDIYVLEDVRKHVNKPEEQILHCPEWYGCLYYEIVEKKDGNKTFYTLMGFDFNNLISYKKYIDILTFNPQGIPSFGAPVFVEDRGAAKCRIILEYWSKSAVHLSYHADIDKLVFNWLYPMVPERTQDKSSYVPDVTFDGFEFKNGKWIKVKNVLLKKNL